MTAGLLPLERIPIFVWGAVLAMIGGALALQADALTWAQLKAVAMLVLGLAAVAYDLVMRNRRHKQSAADRSQEGVSSKQA